MPGLRLVAELGGDGSGFQAMMNRANMTAKNFGTQSIAPLKNLIAGAFTVGAVSALSRKTVEFASHLRDVSDALRVNVEWFQKRANAAKLAGGNEDDLFKFIDTMTKTRAAAVQKPGGEEAKTLQRLGFTGAEIQGLNTMDFFDKLVKAYGDGANAQTAVDIEKVGGKSARNLLAAFGNQFQSDAPIMTAQMVDALDDIGDEFTILQGQLMIALAPAIIFVIDKLKLFVSALQGAGAWLGAQTAVTKKDRQRQYDTAKAEQAFVKEFRAAHSDLTEEQQKRLSQIELRANQVLNDPGLYNPGSVALDAQVAEVAKEANSMEAAKAKLRDLRKRHEQGPPGFEPLDLKETKHAALPTDALVGIGNFLGRNPALVNNIAGQQLQVARQHLDISRQILGAIKGSKGGLPGTENIQVPAG